MEAVPATTLPVDSAAPSDELRLRRLAEMVHHLTDCDPSAALHAVQRAVRSAPKSMDDALSVVARAIIVVKRGMIDLRDQIELS